MYFYCKCLQYWFLSTQVLAAECELGSHMFFSRVLAPGRNGPQVLTLQSTLQYFCFSTGVLAPGICGPHVARCARCGSQGEWRAPVWKPSQLCGRSSVLLCGNYPTYVASQQFVPYCPSYSFLPPRSMCALPQFVLIPCFPSGGETIQTVACLNILLLFCLNIWPTTNMFVILPSDFHTHMTSHYCLPRQFESQYKSLFVQWIEHCVWIFQSGLWQGPQPAWKVWDFWS